MQDALLRAPQGVELGERQSVRPRRRGRGGCGTVCGVRRCGEADARAREASGSPRLSLLET